LTGGAALILSGVLGLSPAPAQPTAALGLASAWPGRLGRRTAARQIAAEAALQARLADEDGPR